MENKVAVDTSFGHAYASVTLARDPQKKSKGAKSLPSDVSMDEINGSMELAKDPLEDSKELQSLFSAVSFSKFDAFKYPSDMDGAEYSPPYDVGNDFIVTQVAKVDSPTQPFPEIIEPEALYFGFEKVAHCLVKAFLTYLVEGFSKPCFQMELQKLLMSARKSQQPGIRSKKVVFGRCALSQAVEEEALANIGFAKTATVSAWKLVSLFLREEKVLAQLGLLDELLALPPSSNYNAVLHCSDRC